VASEIVMPRLSDSMEEGTILKWLVSEGDAVTEGQPLVEVETDKAVVPVEAESAGELLRIMVGEGTSVPVGAPIAMLGTAGETLPERGSAEALAAVGAPAPALGTPAAAVAESSAPARAHTATNGTSSPAPPSSAGARVKASPLARRIAVELSIDITALVGSGPNGRVIRADVERAAADGDIAVAADGDTTPAADGDTTPAAASSPGPEPAAAGGAKGAVTRHELSRRQQIVARRMSESRATVPDIELRIEIDMTEAVALREQLRGVSGDGLPSLNDVIVKAVALTLREFPRVNGAYRDGSFEEYTRVNVGIAVAAEDALVVPTVFDADTKSLGAIAAATRTLAERVRDGSITPSELGGATFSISNLGMYGIDGFSAVINPPQAAILAVGAVRRRPVVDDAGAIVARQTVQLSLACDHRIVYGVDGARFMARLRERLEQPLSLLL
jgi:pyruvate dehydrogenase E2 component (dihydrolipoamide acetyltransferase)